MTVQIPMYRPLSFRKKDSDTTALPMELAGQMKKATMARHTAMVLYDGLTAQPRLPTRLHSRETRKMGRRP
jgi:hypothetical protein